MNPPKAMLQLSVFYCKKPEPEAFQQGDGFLEPTEPHNTLYNSSRSMQKPKKLNSRVEGFVGLGFRARV